MTELLERAVEALKQMPAAEQDGMARAILRLAEDGLDDIEPEHLPYVLEGLAQAERGEFAEGTAREILAAAFRRHAP